MARRSKRMTFPQRWIFALISGALTIAAGEVAAQAPLTFAVASIKPAAPDQQSSGLRLLPGGGLNVMNTPISRLISFAYEVQDFQVSGGPNWMATEGYDILAKPDGTDEADFRQMADAQRQKMLEQIRERLRSLLAERFQLTVHRQEKETSVYNLVLAKGGAKMQASKEGDGGNQTMRVGRGTMSAQRWSMPMLARTLGGMVGRPVLDQTGLKDFFDFQLEWTPEMSGPGERQEAAPQGTPGPSLFTALQEQLGVKLEAGRGPAPMLVVDRLERPSGN